MWTCEGLSVPAMVLDAGRACRAMSGWEELWACCSLGRDIKCCPTSVGGEATSRVCWEGTVVGGKCEGLIFSAISCSLILSIRTRLSNCKKSSGKFDRGHQVTWDTKPSEENIGGNFYLGFGAWFGKPHCFVQICKNAYCHAFLHSNATVSLCNEKYSMTKSPSNHSILKKHNSSKTQYSLDQA